MARTERKQRGNPALLGKNVERRRETDDWFYRFKVDGIPYYGSCVIKDKRAAEKIAAELKAEKKVQARHHRQAGLGPMTFGRACDLWWDDEGCTNVETGLKFRLDWLCNQIGKDTLLSEIAISEITKVRNERAKCLRPDGKGEDGKQQYRTLTPAAVNATLVTMRTVINHAGKRHGAAVRIFNWPDFIKKDNEEYDVRVMSDTEQGLIWPQLDDDMREIADVDLRCGKRINEILPLIWPRIDLIEGHMRIKIKGRNKPVNSPLGKGLVARLKRLQDRKLHPTAVFTFVAQRTREYNGERYVKGQRYPVKYSYFEKKWREACERVGITDLNIHCIRHTAATRLYRTTADIYKVSEMLDHKDIATTKRYYMRTNPDVIREATDALDRREQEKLPAKLPAEHLKIVS